MAFLGGALNVVGITPEFVNESLSSLARASTSQVWQGSGRSFLSRTGQKLAGSTTTSAVNVAVNTFTGQEVESVGGVLLDAGQNILAPALTSYLTGPLADQVNRSISKTLESAGPFGSALSGIASNLVGNAADAAGNFVSGLLGVGGGGVSAGLGAIGLGAAAATNYKMFPGGGGEPSADYGGKSYTLTDVVFSIQPANSGPQSFGMNQSMSIPGTSTILPANQYTSMPPLAGSSTVNLLKQAAIEGNLSRFSGSASPSEMVFSGSLL